MASVQMAISSGVIVPFITWHSLVSSLSPNYLNTDLNEYDSRLVYVDLWQAQRFFDQGGGIATFNAVTLAR